MKIWLDAQLSPSLATWLAATFGDDVAPLRDLGLRHASDREVFLEARLAGAVVLTKDADFVALVARLGSPPPVIWLRCGNSSNSNVVRVLESSFVAARALVEAGESVVEIREAPTPPSPLQPGGRGRR